MKLLSFNTGLWHVTFSVMALPTPRGLMKCDEFPVTYILTDLKGQISHQFISSSVQREIWTVCHSELKLMGKSWRMWTICFTLETCCFPRESCKGRDGTRKARGWKPVRIRAAEDEKSTIAKEASQHAGAMKEMSKIWGLVNSLCLMSPKHVPESSGALRGVLSQVVPVPLPWHEASPLCTKAARLSCHLSRNFPEDMSSQMPRCFSSVVCPPPLIHPSDSRQDISTLSFPKIHQ